MPPPESRTPLKAAFCWSRLRAVAVGLLLAFAVSAPLEAANDTATKLKAGSEDLNRVRAKIGAANQSIDRDRSAQSTQRQAVETAERKIAESQAQLKKLAAEVEEQDARLRAAQASRAAAEARLVQARERLARQVRSAYVAGQGGSTALLLSQEEPDRIGRLLTYFDYLNRASARNMDEINAEIAAVSAEEAKVETERSALQKLQTTRQRALAELENDRNERKKAVASLDARIADAGEKVKALQSSEKEIQALLGKLREALKAVPAPARPSGSKNPFPKMRGVLAWPLRGNILANYGDSKSDSRLLWERPVDCGQRRRAGAGQCCWAGGLCRLAVELRPDRGHRARQGFLHLVRPQRNGGHGRRRTGCRRRSHRGSRQHRRLRAQRPVLRSAARDRAAGPTRLAWPLKRTSTASRLNEAARPGSAEGAVIHSKKRCTSLHKK